MKAQAGLKREAAGRNVRTQSTGLLFLLVTFLVAREGSVSPAFAGEFALRSRAARYNTEDAPSPLKANFGNLNHLFIFWFCEHVCLILEIYGFKGTNFPVVYSGRGAWMASFLYCYKSQAQVFLKGHSLLLNCRLLLSLYLVVLGSRLCSPWSHTFVYCKSWCVYERARRLTLSNTIYQCERVQEPVPATLPVPSKLPCKLLDNQTSF